MPPNAETKLPEARDLPHLGPTLEKWAKTRLAHQAVMLEDAQEVAALGRAMAKAHFEENTGAKLAEPQDMGVHIGDIYTQQETQAPPSTKPWRVGRALVLIAASVLGGAGTALGLASLLSSRTAEVTRKMEPQEFEVKFWIEGDKLKLGKPTAVK